MKEILTVEPVLFKALLIMVTFCRLMSKRQINVILLKAENSILTY